MPLKILTGGARYPHGPMRLLLATAGAALALAAPAQAAYAPKVSLTIDPATANALPAVTSVITQQQGETASKTVAVTFPKAFQPNFGGLDIDACSRAQEDAKACPPRSQIGTAEATASVVGIPAQLTGTVNFGGPVTVRSFRLIVFLHNDLIGDQKVIGTAELLPGGGARTIFDNLPDTLTTSFKLALAGGSKSLLKNPSTCGDQDVTASFTSQQGEQATGTQKVTITGCKPIPLRIADVALTKTRVTFDVNQPGRATVTIKRAKKRVASGAFALKTAGTAKVKVPKLKPGKYVVAIRFATDDGRASSARFTRTLH